MKRINLLIGLLLISFLFSCNIQDLEKYNEEFKGEWRTDVFYYPVVGDSIRNYLTIDGKDSGFGIACDIKKPFTKCLYLQTGKAKYNKSNQRIQIGSSIDHIHIVDKEPFVEGGKWKMIVDSTYYYKY